MVSVNNFIVTEIGLKKWRTRYGETPRCRVCDKEFKVGDMIESKNAKRGTKRCHEDCLYTTPISSFGRNHE